MKQLELLKKENNAYGGELLKTREGRSKPRPLDTKHSMHLVLRSSKAKGPWSFKRCKNQRKIFRILDKFAKKYGIKILSFANVGNHLHIHLKLTNRHTYAPFIRATTSAIAMTVTGVSRWSHSSDKENESTECKELREGGAQKKHLVSAAQTTRTESEKTKNKKFWDYRPYTRVIRGLKAILNLKDYIRINELEGYGYKKDQARFLVAWDKAEYSLITANGYENEIHKTLII